MDYILTLVYRFLGRLTDLTFHLHWKFPPVLSAKIVRQTEYVSYFEDVAEGFPPLWSDSEY